MQKRSTLLLFLLPALIYIVIWRIAPLPYTLFLSFHKYSLVTRQLSWVGLQNYFSVISDPRYLEALKRTILLTVACVSLQLLIGLGMATLMDQEPKGKSAFSTIFFLPMFVAPATVGIIWYLIFAPVIGPVDYLSKVVLGKDIKWLGSPIPAFFSVVISDVWEWTPFTFILILAGLKSIPKELYEAARVDGASAAMIFLKITVPYLASTFLIVTLFRSMDAFRIFAKVFALTGGGPGTATETLGFLIYKGNFIYHRVGYSSAMVIPPLVFLGIIYYVFVRRVLLKKLYI